MTYDEFLTRIIDDGIAAARADYAKPEQVEWLEGSIAGFEACRGKNPLALRELLTAAMKNAGDARVHNAPPEDYWYLKCLALEVEWVANCVSALLVNQDGHPLASHLPTARAVMKAAEVIGVAPMEKGQ